MQYRKFGSLDGVEVSAPDSDVCVFRWYPETARMLSMRNGQWE